MSTKRINNPKTHVDVNAARKDSKNFNKGQFVGDYKPRPACFGKNCHSVPDPYLCETCTYLDDCKKEYYGVKG